MMVGCAGAAHSAADGEMRAPEPRPSRTTDLRVVDTFDGRTFVVLEQLGVDEAFFVVDPDDEPTPDVVPTPDAEVSAAEYTFYGPEGTCLATHPRPVRLDAYGMPYPRVDGGESRADRVRFSALEVDAPCPGRIAMVGPPRPDIRYEPIAMREPTDEELDEEIGDLSRIDHGSLPDGSEVLLQVGRMPPDDVCPESVTYAFASRGGAPGLSIAVGVEQLVAVLRIGGSVYGVANFYHLELLPPDATFPRFALPIPSQTGFDIYASPCL